MSAGVMRRAAHYLIAVFAAVVAWLLANAAAGILIEVFFVRFQIFPDIGVSLLAATISAVGVAFIFNLRAARAGSAGHAGLLVCVVVVIALLVFGALTGIYTVLDETPPQRVRLEGKFSNAYAVWFSADGRTLVGLGKDFVHPVLRHWDARTGALQKSVRLSGNDYLPLEGAVFSPDGRTVAVPDSTNKAVKLWDVATGESKLEPVAVGDECCVGGIRIIFSPDSKAFVTASQGPKGDPVVKLWDARAGEVKRTLHGELAAFSPDGSALAVRDRASETIKVWDARASELKLVLSAAGFGRASLLVFSPDARMLISNGSPSAAGGGPDLGVWDLQTGRYERRLGERRTDVLVFSPDGRLIALNDRHMVEVYDARTWGRLRRFQPYEISRSVMTGPRGKGVRSYVSFSPPRTISFSPDGKTIVTTCSAGSVRLWDVSELNSTDNHHTSSTYPDVLNGPR